MLRTGNFIRPDDVLRDIAIREGMRVVHFGCGPGFFVVPAAKFVGPSGRVVAIDIRVPAIEEVTHRVRSANLANVDILRSDLTVPGGSQLPDGWADLVILVNILHQSDPRLILAEAARVVRQGVGRVFVLAWELVNVPIGPPVEYRVTPDQLLAGARSANLVLLRRWKPSTYHYALVFARTVPEA